MADIGQIRPATPVWQREPSRKVEDRRRRDEKGRNERRAPSEDEPQKPERSPGDGHIDEYV